jgi:tetratricopeptide (TPR) repeat protein
MADSVEIYPKAKAAALRGLEIDPGSAEAYTSLATVKGSFEWDRKGAERDYRHAIALNPNYATAHHWYADHLVSLARFDEGMAEIAVAQSLDPLSLVMNADVGGYLFYAGRYDESLALIRKMMELEPDYVPVQRQLGGVYEQQGKFEEAIATFEKTRRLTGGATYSLTALAHTHALAGHREEAMKMLAEIEEVAKRKYVSNYGVAAVHVALDDPDRAFQYLDRAVRSHDRAMIWLKVSPRWNRIRSDARFQSLLRTVGAE